MIRFDDVSVTYPGGTKGLDGVTLEIPRGQFVVVVGLSGAGKSTLVRTINGLVPVSSGTLEVEGQRVDGASRRKLRALRTRVGMIFQAFNLVERASVLTNVLTGRLHATPAWRALFGAWRKPDIELAFQALERVNIVEKAYTRASSLSGGQQQRVAIARALAQEPAVILADEPVASLDPPTANLVMRDLQRINRDLGITTVVNLHFLDLATSYAERIIGMREGQVVFDGTPAETNEAVFAEIYGRALKSDDVLPGTPAGGEAETGRRPTDAS
ncbi:phosphonate ABC transporter ATP-binding protein [Microbacterium sp. LRZ72]|uniref:phosphonate ABC transporter ATP-binding protein n=1 Tax=Microbacterium sp. LRZ72 TaxID=2942481 RepID=UPI0029A8A284|nr:phosphonate ABC transporter ATP-binding protein [Microbacterium sp. LRZ72]MDX2375863.1 phosphonate ABC transporter ATP-binding protein [Microbacterium sp. LRZ72]